MKYGLTSLLAMSLLIGTVRATPPPTPPESSVALMYRGNHVALRVADLATAVDWWKTLFGAREVRRSRVPNIDPAIEIAFLHIACGFHIELVGGGTPVDAGAPKDIGTDYQVARYKHVGFLVDDLERVLAHMARHGVVPDYRIERPDYGVAIALIREPSGRYVELYAPLADEDS